MFEKCHAFIIVYTILSVICPTVFSNIITGDVNGFFKEHGHDEVTFT